MEEGKKLREKVPGVSNTEVSTKVGEAWQKLSEKDRKKFNDLAEKDKIRF